ncbi:MAG: hypothetical protein ACYTF7_10450 [Planctomycetota bacterium]|jgi:hypothetical protein
MNLRILRNIEGALKHQSLAVSLINENYSNYDEYIERLDEFREALDAANAAGQPATEPPGFIGYLRTLIDTESPATP